MELAGMEFPLWRIGASPPDLGRRMTNDSRKGTIHIFQFELHHIKRIGSCQLPQIPKIHAKVVSVQGGDREP